MMIVLYLNTVKSIRSIKILNNLTILILLEPVFHECRVYLIVNKTLWERILGRRCIRNIGMYIIILGICMHVISGFDDRE